MASRVEVWAGIECSYNRVGENYFDQLERAGLYGRPDAIEQLADLGVHAVRIPVLWERVIALGERAWAWTDVALERLRERGVQPILGLMHHGSGPAGTSLIDDDFPSRFAEFARRVAERYPWVQRFTPINEPLTTARFATLYGHWYPHETSPRAFARAMVRQAAAIGAAMRAIRSVSPLAELIQTEDLGKTYATPVLQYQAAFENERRWLTFDLLLGRVVDGHPLAGYLRWAGLEERELEALALDPCPPDVIGVNHYLTSERYLDHRRNRYPRESWGGNGRHRYADVEAVRVLGGGVAGPSALLLEAWQRYRRPIAVTEVQLACTREQQLRWLHEVWTATSRLSSERVEIRAITAWAAFGAHDWSSLLTRNDGHYEPGLFDIRAHRPRRTAVAEMVRSLATSGTFDHPVLAGVGWWRCDSRLAYPAVTSPPQNTARPSALGNNRAAHEDALRSTRSVMIVGANGTLGRAFVEACTQRGLSHVKLSRADLDVTNEHATVRALGTIHPWLVINCAGFVRVDDAEHDKDACRTSNVAGPKALARGCATFGIKLVTFSTDLVFDGTKDVPYVESDPIRPLCEYGRAKGEAERAVLLAADNALVVRTAAFFADHDEYNFATLALRELAAGRPFMAAHDVVVSPTYLPDLVNTVLDLAIDDEVGVWHLANAGAVTWADFARRAAHAARVSTDTLFPVSLADLRLSAPRPRYSALGSERASIMAPVDDAIERYARSRAWERAIAVAPARPDEIRPPTNHFIHLHSSAQDSRHEELAGAGMIDDAAHESDRR